MPSRTGEMIFKIRFPTCPSWGTVCHGLQIGAVSEYGKETEKGVKLKMYFSVTDLLSPKWLLGWHVFQQYVVLYGRGAFDKKAEKLNRKKIKKTNS